MGLALKLPEIRDTQGLTEGAQNLCKEFQPPTHSFLWPQAALPHCGLGSQISHSPPPPPLVCWVCGLSGVQQSGTGGLSAPSCAPRIFWGGQGKGELVLSLYSGGTVRPPSPAGVGPLSCSLLGGELVPGSVSEPDPPGAWAGSCGAGDRYSSLPAAGGSGVSALPPCWGVLKGGLGCTHAPHTRGQPQGRWQGGAAGADCRGGWLAPWLCCSALTPCSSHVPLEAPLLELSLGGTMGAASGKGTSGGSAQRWGVQGEPWLPLLFLC